MDQQVPPTGQDNQNQPPEQNQPAQDPAQQSPQPGQDQQPAKKYSKRPLWFWILLYVVLGTIVYLLVYFFFFADTVGEGGVNPIY